MEEGGVVEGGGGEGDLEGGRVESGGRLGGGEDVEAGGGGLGRVAETRAKRLAVAVVVCCWSPEADSRESGASPEGKSSTYL